VCDNIYNRGVGILFGMSEKAGLGKNNNALAINKK